MSSSASTVGVELAREMVRVGSSSGLFRSKQLSEKALAIRFLAAIMGLRLLAVERG